LLVAGDHRGRALAAAIVEDAADADIVVRLRLEGENQILRRLAAADDHRTPLQPPLAGPAAYQAGRQKPGDAEDDQPGGVPGREPDARIVVAGLGEKSGDRQKGKDQRPGNEDAAGFEK